MGLNASSDEWCRQSDIIIAGLPYAMKIVGDTIIWANSEAELEEWWRQSCKDARTITYP